MYQVNESAARKADAGGSMINELGKYVGTFTQAEDITASTGTKGIAFLFESNAGQKARLSIYTKKSDGTELSGMEAVSAIMTCMKLRSIKPSQGKATHWDGESKSEVLEDATIFPDLCGKQIGLLLETEDYTARDGSLAKHPRIVIKNVFQADTELTASEIWDRKTVPAMLPRMVDGLRHRALKGTKPAAHASQSRSNDGAPDNFDPDCPF